MEIIVLHFYFFSDICRLSEYSTNLPTNASQPEPYIYISILNVSTIECLRFSISFSMAHLLHLRL
jgi:hypothetical protein